MKNWVFAGHLLAILASSTLASAAPVPGFVEHFSGGFLGGFTGGGAPLNNPNTGGALGDGYLRIASPTPNRLAAHSTGLQYVGDWIAAGIVGVELSLRDVDAAQNLEIHFAIGNSENFWLYNPGFVPPRDHWGVFYVDLTDSTKFTHLINFTGAGFSKALRTADRIHVRHDKAPFNQAADFIQGEYGVDEIRLLANPPVDAKSSSWGRIRALYR